ncbi:hypothetical protein GCM10028778_21940 [Barrientosiimonas marina]
MFLKPLVAALISGGLYFIFIVRIIKKKGKENSKPYLGGIIYTILIFLVFLTVYNF